jgi:inhibitor of cysteine peptidase
MRATTLMTLGAATLLAACSTLQPMTPKVVNAASDGGAVTLKKGDTLVVALDANLTTGYRWETTTANSPVLSLIGTPDYLPPAVAPGTVGAPGDTVFRYRAAEPGTTTLELGYLRPFEKGVAPAKTVRYEVTVLSLRPCWLPGTVVCGLE